MVVLMLAETGAAISRVAAMRITENSIAFGMFFCTTLTASKIVLHGSLLGVWMELALLAVKSTSSFTRPINK